MCGCHFSAAFKDCPGCIRAAGPARRGRPPKHTCGSGGAPRSLPLPNDGPVAPVGRKIRSCYAHECLLGRVSARGCGKWLNDVEASKVVTHILRGTGEVESQVKNITYCICMITGKRRSRLSFHDFVAVPMGRAFFRCRLFDHPATYLQHLRHLEKL